MTSPPLQRDANRTLGYTAQQTLDYLQSLYEKKPALTPERTAGFLRVTWRRAFRPWLPSPPSSAGQIPGRLQRGPGVRAAPKSATTTPSSPPLWREMRTGCPACGEREVLRLVSYGLLKSVSPAHRFAETSVTVECGKTDSPPRAERSWRLAGKPTHWNRPTNRRGGRLPDGHGRGRTFPWRTCLSRKARPRPPKHFTEGFPAGGDGDSRGQKICRRTRNAGAWERPPPRLLSWKSWVSTGLWNEKRKDREPPADADRRLPCHRPAPEQLQSPSSPPRGTPAQGD